MIDWETVSVGVFVVVGLIEFAKGFAKNMDGWFWRLALLPASVLVAVTIKVLPAWALTALVILAASQLGYEVVVKNVKKRLGGGQ